MVADKIQLNTLKECLMFLLALHKDSGKQHRVASELYGRLSGKYNTVNQQHIESALTNFLGSVSKFHTKLCKNANAVNNGKQDPTAVLNALLECIPKFLAVTYFLRYNVDDKFSALGGGKWAGLQVGMSTILGGQLTTYLLAKPGSTHYGVIPGGFGRHELRRAYRYGRDMATDLTAICEKYDGQYFRDVFSTSVLRENSGTQGSNTANGLALVRTFCLIVGGEKDGGGTLITKLNEHFKDKQHRICWNNLKEHCEKLKSEFSKIFNDHRFSFTGFGGEPQHLEKEEFAKETAEWLRGNLDKVKDKLTKIKTDKAMTNTADYFNKYLFPYGFTFDKYNFEGQKRPYDVLSGDWANVINELRQKSEGLDRLKTILEGEVCPEDEDSEDEKKAEGAQNQGNGQTGRNLPPSPGGNSAVPVLPSGNDGATGPAGPPSPVLTVSATDQDTSVVKSATAPSPGAPGGSGPSGPPEYPQSPGSSSKGAVQVRQTAILPPVVQPPISPPSVPASPSPPGHTGSPGQGSSSDGSPSAKPAAPPGPTLTQPSGVSVPGAGLTAGQGAGSQGGGGAGQDGSQNGSQDVNQPTSQDTDHGSSSGPTPSAGSLIGYPIKPPKWSGPQIKSAPVQPPMYLTGQPVAHTALSNALPPPPIIKPAGQRDVSLTNTLGTVSLDDQLTTQLTDIICEIIKNEAVELSAAEIGNDLRMQMYSSELTGVPVSTSVQSAQEHSQKVRKASGFWEDSFAQQKQQNDDEDRRLKHDFQLKQKDAEAQRVQMLLQEVTEEVEHPKALPRDGRNHDALMNFDLDLRSSPPPFIMEKDDSPIVNAQDFDPSKMPPDPKSERPPGGFYVDIFIPRVTGESDYTSAELRHFNDLVKLEKPALNNELWIPADKYQVKAFDFTVSATDALAKEGFIPTCRNPWYVPDSSYVTDQPTPSPPQDSDLLPPPKTVREMLHWLVGLTQYGYIGIIEDHVEGILREYNNDVSDALEVTGDPYNLGATRVANTLTQACLYSATVLHNIRYNDSKDAPTTLNFSSEYSKFRYSSDPACLLCQLRDYVYVCYHQLAFLKSQCSRVQSEGGWQDCRYGHKVHNSPLQAFLTDTSKFKTHLFDPCDICHKSRVNMGFTKDYLAEKSQDGAYVSTILTPTCGGGLRLRTRLTTPLLHLQNRPLITFNRTLNKSDVEAAQDLVQKILDEVNGNPPANKNELDKAIETVENKLQERVSELAKWKEAANGVLEGTIQNSETVNTKLDPTQQKDPPEGTVIGQGLQKIEEAKTAVEGVNSGLQTVHSNLTTWNSAARGVLDKVVQKAQNVHGRLQPTGSEKIGKSIGEIDTARKGLVEANSKLDTQVKSLDKWITEAERIRAAAEKKAKEAYDKLKVNETLSQNVQKIVAANKTINEVYGKLDGHVGDLGKWKDQASTVLEGAIKQATEVHDNLLDKNTTLGNNIDGITSAKDLIIGANTKLAGHVSSLESWNKAAKEVITKAEGKCDEILKRVKTEQTAKGPIFTQAQILKGKGTELFKAATAAKKAVESEVLKALKAVVQMDKSLKMDLFNVKGKIKGGIESVIQTLEVEKLDEKVIKDLGILRGKIEGLSTNVETSKAGSGLVGTQLQTLASKKTELDNGAVKSIQNAENGLGQKFTDHIQSALNEKVRAVYTAIGKLGGKFNLDAVKKQKFEEIFNKIKEEVNKILNGDQPNRGLQGIANGLINSYANGFKNTFHTIVGGWAEGILGNNESGDKKKNIKQWLEQYVTERNGNGGQAVTLLKGGQRGFLWSQEIIKQIKNELQHQIDAGKGKVEIANASIQKTIDSVKQGCETFAEKLDQKLRDSGIGNLANQIFQGIAKGVREGTNYKAVIEPAIEAALLGLSATASQVANEIKSILLGTYRVNGKSIASELDSVIGYTKKLDGQLDQATQNVSTPPTPEAGTAQAVDKKLEVVRTMVNSTITDDFKEKVKKDLETAVRGLPTAVDAFNTEAQSQIKEAAKTAIDKAAGQISATSDIDVKSVMEQFSRVYSPIRDNLQDNLHSKVDDELPNGDGSNSATHVKLDAKKFGGYDSHVKQDSQGLTTGNLQGKNGDGQLPQAIGKIRDEGLSELTDIIDDSASPDRKIDNTTFTEPFNTIQKELEEIKKFVYGNGSFIEDGKDKGVKKHLANLKTMLNKGSFVNGGKGLDSIKTAIDGLQKGTYSPQPAAIEEAVQEIRKELGELRQKLKNNSKDDVIERLTDLNKAGLGKSAWNGKKLSGLGKIESELKKQNEILGKQPGIIDKAVSEIKYQLAVVGVKLRNVGNNDDILNPLQRFKRRIGKNAPEPGNLQKICNEIQKLQEGPFRTQPEEIRKAKEEIVKELTALQGELQGTQGEDVITTLQDLQNTGLSGNKWDKNAKENGKSLKNIQDALQGQQTALSNQPGEIGGGVQSITGELERLQKQLNTEVTERLQKLRDHGLNDGDTAWTSENKPLTGVQKITADIEAIKEKDVEDVKEKLKELCRAISNATVNCGASRHVLNNERIDDRIMKRCIDSLQLKIENT
ncbi:Extracellular matrix-binding ebh [Babesia ovata]|uniref:Extracellular matrix-binding ebh n=1 Tax=Babesia ovata TaxID=189622 RepID=A0A2H6KDE1_9APIC|nr:Extracellular matrix-binding ebh [Babesia ovata]GBE61018.1 Extracellular matrix-binding ebh [Babesia ovata]